MYRYTTFALASLFPVGLRSSNRLRLVKVRVKSTEKFNVHILVISIVIPAAQSQDAYIRLLEGIENTVITAANAVQPAIHMLELLLDLRVRRRILHQEIDLFHTWCVSFGGKASNALKKSGFWVTRHSVVIRSILYFAQLHYFRGTSPHRREL